jgi:hypothetical protein
MINRDYSVPMIFAVALAFFFIFSPQKGKSESPRTITLQSGEVVCDLNGEWNALYENYGQCAHWGKQKVILQIKQEGNKFVAIKLSGGDPSTKGNEVIRGELDQKGLKKIQFFSVGWRMWADSKGEITDGCKKIIFEDAGCLKATVERK